MSEHTPGPWKVHEHTEFTPIASHPEHGLPDFEIFSESDKHSRTVAHSKRFYKDNKRDIETQRANARLIAAAPELLAACGLCRDTFTSGEGKDLSDHDRYEILQDHIQKKLYPALVAAITLAKG